MNKSTRNTLRNVVTQCRRLLEDSIAELLQGQFGIHASGKIEDAGQMSHLSTEDQDYRAQILVHLHHIQAGGQGSAASLTGAGEKNHASRLTLHVSVSKETVAQLIREVAFTHLNRLAAYKMMETRGLIREAVSRGLKSQGFMFYLADHPADEKLWSGGQQDVAYRHFLVWLGSTLSEEIGVLFSPHDPANRLLPPQRVLDQVLELLNSPDLSGIWAEDETIGWIYQYFTPKELRDQARKESQAPRNSYELAFRNQFYTPRYVVQFLTDNTLGRIWYEMRQGETALVEQCAYLVRRPNEVFLAEGEAPPSPPQGGTASPPPGPPQGRTASPPSGGPGKTLQSPVYIPYRAKKDPRDLKILDPACGSGHFLLYCFDLLETIYAEAYTDPDLGLALQADYPTLADLQPAIPGLILRHNLHGIDIDLRAVQIASLALWLRAQRAYQELGLPADVRPRITRVNIVCAEPMPGNPALLAEFMADLHPPILGQLVQAVFHQMELAGEAGALLKIEEELADAINAAKAQWLAGPQPEQLTLFADAAPPKPEQLNLFDLSGITDENFWENAEERVLRALHAYAQQAASSPHGGEPEGGRLARQLFAEDAVQGFAFIDLCRQRFDVVLMNPPFGVAAQSTKEYFNKTYFDWNNNLLCCFIDRMIGLTDRNGKIGAIYDKTAWVKLTYEKFRRNVLLNKGAFGVSADLGWEVLDANVEVVANIIDAPSSSGNEIGIFYDMKSIPTDSKGDVLLKFINMTVRDDNSNPEYTATNFELEHLPNAVIAYDILPFVKRLFSKAPSMVDAGFQSYTGAQIRSEQHFFVFWERPQNQNLGSDQNYSHLYNGGEYIRYYMPPRDIVLFGPNGSKVDQSDNSYTWRLRLKSTGIHYYEPGIGFGVRGDYLDAHLLSKGHIFTVEGQSMPVQDEGEVWLLLGLLNSPTYQVIINTFCGQHKYSGYINLLPYPKIDNHLKSEIVDLVKKQFHILRDWYKLDQTTLNFSHNRIIAHCKQKSLREIQIHILTEMKTCHEELKDFFIRVSRLIEEVSSLSTDSEFSEVRNVENIILQSGIPTLETDLSSITGDFFDYVSGLILARWDIRIALNPTLAPPLQAPFDPLPACPPGALVGPDGLPATPGNIVSEEWLRARPNAITLPPEGSVAQPTIPDEAYPLRLDWDGILVDDPDHPDDIIRRVRDVLDLLWEDHAEAIEQEAGDILGVKTLRDYFRKPGSGGFWDDHVKRYSKSRRKAPIYWLLQSSRKNYALWLYYHRLDKDMLYKALVNYVEPKLRLEQGKLDQLRAQRATFGTAGREAKELEKQLDHQESFLSELHDFAEKLRRAANLNLEPDLNDGVVLNIAPLWELVPWREAQQYWEELLAGKYEWSSVGKQLREKSVVK